MNYRHIYHAGNFADVVKHIVLIALLRSFHQKDAPFCFLESHAGIGVYPLDSPEAQKKQEYQNGIGKLFDAVALAQLIQDYLKIISHYNNLNQLHYYPGSPLIAEHYLREQDQMILCELHAEDIKTLKNNIGKNKQIAIHHLDGYLGMKAFLPPTLKRGLVLIDPPFEATDEFENITQAVKKALTHWRSGQFMIWYPIKNHAAVEKFYSELKKLNAPHLIIQYSLNNIVEPEKLFSCGIAIINPPWKIEATLEAALSYVASILELRFTLTLANMTNS